MATNTQVNIYDGSYTSFSGADAVATFNGQVIGELQAVSVNTSREKGPVYVMGNASPISFSRGKRGIAGNLVFVTFDRDALLTEMESVAANSGTIPQYTAAGNYAYLNQTLPNANVVYAPGSYNGLPLNAPGSEFNSLPTNVQFNQLNNQALASQGQPFVQLHGEQPGEFWVYEDQVPPFDIVITFANEYGDAAYMAIYGAEILNEGIGISIDDVMMERACTFVAREVTRIRPGFASVGTANTTQPISQSFQQPGS